MRACFWGVRWNWKGEEGGGRGVRRCGRLIDDIRNRMDLDETIRQPLRFERGKKKPRLGVAASLCLFKV